MKFIIEDFLPVAQLAEAKVLKTFQCGFETHSGDVSQFPISPNKDILNYISDKYFYENGKVLRLLKDGYSIKELGTYSLKTGYYHIDIKLGRKEKGRRLKRSHIVWFINKGYWPEKELDHKDRNKTNDGIDNLREVTTQFNVINSDACDNIKIACRWKKRKYCVEFTLRQKKIYLGSFTFDMANEVANYVCEYLNSKNLGVNFYV